MDRPLTGFAFALVLALLGGCGGGGDDDSPDASWIRIDSPQQDQTIYASSVLVKGNASTSTPQQPTTVYWTNSAGGSGILAENALCVGIWPFGTDCLIAFEGQVPLAVGLNTITVRLDEGASNSVTVTRPLLASISGKVLMDTGEYVNAVTVTLSGDGSPSLRVDGEYVFDWLSIGDYTITPSLPLPQSASCLRFSPTSRDVRIITGDVAGLDFTAAQLAPCFKVHAFVMSGGTYGELVPVVLKDADGHEYRVTVAPATFWHVAAGTYTVTPQPPPFTTIEPPSAIVTVTGSDEIVYFELVR